jgi:hypothetical protein
MCGTSNREIKNESKQAIKDYFCVHEDAFFNLKDVEGVRKFCIALSEGYLNNKSLAIICEVDIYVMSKFLNSHLINDKCITKICKNMNSFMDTIIDQEAILNELGLSVEEYKGRIATLAHIKELKQKEQLTIDQRCLLLKLSQYINKQDEIIVRRREKCKQILLQYQHNMKSNKKV